MASEKKTGLGAAAASLLRPTTPPESSEPIAAAEPGRGGELTPAALDQVDQAEGRTAGRSPRRRKGTVPTSSKLEGRRLYLSESTHFRLRMLAYQRGQKLSEVAEELLDKSLPKWDVSRVG